MTKPTSQFDIRPRDTWRGWIPPILWAIGSLVFLLAILWYFQALTDNQATECASGGGKPLYEKVFVYKSGYVYRFFECKK